MPRRRPAVKLKAGDGGRRHHGTAAYPLPTLPRKRGRVNKRRGQKKRAPCVVASWRPVREIAREEIANLSSFVVAAPPMVQWAPIRH